MSLKDFSILQKLGQGSYAKVYKALRLNDQKIYAIKQIHMYKLDQKSKQNALNQIRFLASFDCKNIIKYYETFFDEQLSLLCIVMQYADGGDLSRLIQQRKTKSGKFYEVQIWKALISLMHGIGYLHERSILHRDIKPQNIFLCNGLYKIGDLNVSKVSEDYKKNQTQIGTPFYASPQIWQNSPYDHKCDVWSLGCLIYQMATLNPPFTAKSMDKLYNQVTTGRTKPIPKHFSNQLSSIINKCLQKQPNKRPTIKQLQQNFTIKMYQNLYYTAQQLDVQKIKYSPLLKTITFEKGKSIKQLEFPQPNYQNNNNFIISKSIQPIKEQQTETFRQNIKQNIKQKQQFVTFQSNSFHQLPKQKDNKQKNFTIEQALQKIQLKNPIVLNQKTSNEQKYNSNKKSKPIEKLKIDQPIYKIGHNYLQKLMGDNRKARNNFQICISKKKQEDILKNNIENKIKNQIYKKPQKQYKIIDQILQKQNKPLSILQNKLQTKNSIIQKSLQQSNKNRRSLPRTQFSAKKLQTIQQAQQNKKQIVSTFLQCNNNNNNQNQLDYKNILITKLPKDMIQSVLKNKQYNKKSIIQELVNSQKTLLKNRVKQNRNSKDMYNSKQKQIKIMKNRRDGILSNAHQIILNKRYPSGLKSAQSSVNL